MSNRPGYRILGTTKEEHLAATKERQAGAGVVGRRILHRRGPLQEAAKLKQGQQRVADMVAKRRKGKDAPLEPEVKLPPEGERSNQPDVNVKDAIKAVRAKDSPLTKLAAAELGRPKPRKRVLEVLADEFASRKLKAPTMLLAVLEGAAPDTLEDGEDDEDEEPEA